MVFSEPGFIFLFLPVLLVLYRLSPNSLKNYILLLFSILFYAWGEGVYVLVMLASITFNYLAGLWLVSPLGQRRQQLVLTLAVAGNLALLATFKYLNLFADTLSVILPAGLQFHLMPVHLPIGISFFTFQAMSYILDVHRGHAQVERNPFRVALYITLFPQLIAGPIVRYQQVARELVRRTVTGAGMARGVRRFIIGLGKKVIIANGVAWTADQIFSLPPGELSMPIAWLGLVCYTLQIYFDFSGYSDMAIGLGAMFGFHFPENFNYPYISRSITEFWRRWHISLSTWFRDYLYIPLGGNRGPMGRTYFNLVLVFVLCGLWHGASWTFLGWGLYHGAFLVIERLGAGRWMQAKIGPVQHVYTMLVVMIGWVMFRADDLVMTQAMLQSMFGMGQIVGPHALSEYLNVELGLIIVAGIIGSGPVLPWLRARYQRLMRQTHRLERFRMELCRQAATVCFMTMVLVYASMQLAAGNYSPFIYFRF